MGIPYVAVVTTSDVKANQELLLDEYGASYWEEGRREFRTLTAHWAKSSPAHLRAKYGCSLENIDQLQQFSTRCGTVFAPTSSVP